LGRDPHLRECFRLLAQQLRDSTGAASTTTGYRSPSQMPLFFRNHCSQDRPRRLRRSLLAVAGLGLLVPAGASADTFCAYNPPGCSGTSAANVQAAITAANLTVGRDRIEVGPGVHVETGSDGAGNKVDIVGVGSPVIAGNTALTISEPDSTVSDIELRAQGAGGRTALNLTGTASHVTLSTASGAGNATGVRMLGSSTMLHSTANLRINDPTAFDTAVSGEASSPSDTMTIDDLTGTADQGVYNKLAGHLVASHLALTARDGFRASDGVATLDDSLIVLDTTSGYSRGVIATARAAAAAGTITARHVTVISNGNDSDAFASFTGYAATASLTVSDSVATGATNGLNLSGQSGGTANLSIDYSDYDGTVNSSGTGTLDQGTHNSSTSPGFVNAAGGDFSLAAGSPLIDAGTPGALPADQPTTDLAGNPRIVDGNGDGSAQGDIGAYEFQPAPPQTPGGAAGDTADHLAPSFQTAFKSKYKLKTALKKGITGEVSSNEAGTISGKVEATLPKPKHAKSAKASVVASGSSTASSAGKTKLKLVFTKSARKKLKGLKKVKLTLRFTVTDASGNKSTSVAYATLKR
jgi:hypothetical protein